MLTSGIALLLHLSVGSMRRLERDPAGKACRVLLRHSRHDS